MLKIGHKLLYFACVCVWKSAKEMKILIVYNVH